MAATLLMTCQAGAVNVFDSGDFTFPDGRTKAVVLSYDDGLIQDRQLVALLNRHGLKGTFHLVSGYLGTRDDWLEEFTGEEAQYLSPGEIASLYEGHEVSSHSVSHPALTTVPDVEVIRQVEEDRATLARLSGQTILSHAYPFGDHDDRVVSLLSTTGLKAARTVEESGRFDLPVDMLRWPATAHHLRAMPFINTFLDSELDKPGVLLIMGHSWEFDIDRDGNDWTTIEQICEALAGRDDLWSVGLGELALYLDAARKVEFDGDEPVNRGEVPVWIRHGGEVVRLDVERP